jgi:hypothetical protein
MAVAARRQVVSSPQGWMTLNRERITPLATDSLRVTINYRVGAEGFLYLGNGIANLGFAALEWVQENIGALGGDHRQGHNLRAIGGRREHRHTAVDATRQGAVPPSHRPKRDSP